MTKTKKKTETLADRLTRLRTEKNLTRLALAALAEVSQGAIQLLEKGVTRNPSFSVISKLAGALGVTTDFLVSGVDEAAGAHR